MSNGATKRTTTKTKTKTKTKKRNTKSIFNEKMPPWVKILLWVLLVAFVALVGCVCVGALWKCCFSSSQPAPTEEAPQEPAQKQPGPGQKPKQKLEPKPKQTSEQKSEEQSEQKPKPKTKKVTAACLVQLEVRDNVEAVDELCHRDPGSSPAAQHPV